MKTTKAVCKREMNNFIAYSGNEKKIGKLMCKASK